jgi:hypothetical protein
MNTYWLGMQLHHSWRREKSNNSLAIGKQNDNDFGVNCAEGAIESQRPIVEPAILYHWSDLEVETPVNSM